MNEVTLIEALRALLTVALYINERSEPDLEATASISSIREAQDRAKAIAVEAEAAGKPLADHVARKYVNQTLDVAQWWFNHGDANDIPMPTDGDVREAAQRLVIIDNSL